MNMQLRQCFSRAKLFRLKKSQILSGQILSGFFLFPKKAKGVQKKPNWQP